MDSPSLAENPTFAGHKMFIVFRKLMNLSPHTNMCFPEISDI